MKASITFDRWIKKNAAVIEAADETFRNSVALALLNLKLIESPTFETSLPMAKYKMRQLVELKAEIEKRGLPAPKIELPKIKAVLPLPDKAKRPRR
jgi:hypothetical protein